MTLARLQFWRLGRQVLAVTAAVAVLMGIDILRSGVRADSLLGWLLGGAIILAMMQGVLVIREKVDGSLQVLATLPITGAEHAGASVVVGALLALPAGLLTYFGLRLNNPAFQVSLDWSAAVAAWAGVSVASIGFTAFQLRTRIGTGARSALVALITLFVVSQFGTMLFGHGRLIALRDWLLTRAGLATASIVVWIVLGLVAWGSVRVIARVSESYQGESVQA